MLNQSKLKTSFIITRLAAIKSCKGQPVVSPQTGTGLDGDVTRVTGVINMTGQSTFTHQHVVADFKKLLTHQNWLDSVLQSKRSMYVVFCTEKCFSRRLPRHSWKMCFKMNGLMENKLWLYFSEALTPFCGPRAFCGDL